MMDRIVEYGHHIFMPRVKAVVEDDKALPCRKQPDPRPKSPARNMHSEQPGEPSLRAVRHVEGTAA
jgi:hypothetical protein